MKYNIYFRPVFSTKGKFNGYDLIASQEEKSLEGFDKLSIEGEPQEYLRLKTMVKDMDPFSDQVYFVDRHPLEILQYMRTGNGRLTPNKNPDWEREIPEWRVNMKGEKV